MTTANRIGRGGNAATEKAMGFVPTTTFVRRKRRFFPLICGVAVLAVVALFASVTKAASTTAVIYSFTGEADGEYTDTDLVRDAAGNVYGTTVTGGDFGTGTIFQLTPNGSGGWTHTVLYSFTGGADGGQPYKGVTLDARGNLYGTAVIGGSTGGSCPEDGCGVAYKLTKSTGVWTQKVLHNFTGGNDGYGPGAGLSFDKKGNLYGMTATGGANGLGVIYQLHPGGTWTERVIHTFTGGTDGSSGSAGRLLLDDTDSFYGVATTGGANGKGTAFRLSRSASGKWRFKTLYSFKGQPDAGFPYGALNFDAAGNLYGTTYYDGANNLGAVYQLIRHATGEWNETVLYSFKGGQNGNSSISNVVFDAAGNLYGTTSEGGAGCSCGTIFKLRPGAGGTWTESVAYRFQGVPDAGFAYNGMVPDGAGSFFGATVHGGTNDDGAIYKFTP